MRADCGKWKDSNEEMKYKNQKIQQDNQLLLENCQQKVNESYKAQLEA